MFREHEPAVNLPAEVQEQKKRPGEVRLEEKVRVEVRAPDRVEGNVKRSDKGDNVDEQADPRAPDAEESAEGQLV